MWEEDCTWKDVEIAKWLHEMFYAYRRYDDTFQNGRSYIDVTLLRKHSNVEKPDYTIDLRKVYGEPVYVVVAKHNNNQTFIGVEDPWSFIRQQNPDVSYASLFYRNPHSEEYIIDPISRINVKTECNIDAFRHMKKLYQTNEIRRHRVHWGNYEYGKICMTPTLNDTITRWLDQMSGAYMIHKYSYIYVVVTNPSPPHEQRYHIELNVVGGARKYIVKTIKEGYIASQQTPANPWTFIMEQNQQCSKAVLEFKPYNRDPTRSAPDHITLECTCNRNVFPTYTN